MRRTANTLTAITLTVGAFLNSSCTSQIEGNPSAATSTKAAENLAPTTVSPNASQLPSLRPTSTPNTAPNTNPTNPNQTPEQAPAPTTTAAAAQIACNKMLEITSPAPGTRVDGKIGVLIGVKACGLPEGNTGWLLERTAGDIGEFMIAGGRPAITNDGETALHSAPFGDEGVTKQDVQVHLVEADTNCATEFYSAVRDGDHSVPPTLFPGCNVVDTRVFAATN